MTNTKYQFGAIAILAIVLSGCSLSKDEIAGPPILNGDWASTDGVYVAELRNGNFRAIANDTGSVISQGNYIAISETSVRLEWVSSISGNANKANCVKPSADQLDCTDQGGKTFSLQRKA